MEPIALNRKARYDYFLFEKFEAGIVLLGSEVKSLREGRVNLKDSFVRIIRNEAFLFNCHIPLYTKIQGHLEVDATKSRKLLLKHKEIGYLGGKISQKGFAIVPLSIYFKRGLVKLEIALAKGKKQYDKRESIKRRMDDRESQQAIKQSRRKNQ